MKEDLKASDILVKNPIEEKKRELKIAKEIEKEKRIPAGYIEVKLSSLGKLGLPAVVHVRDYTYEEALKMVELNAENLSEGIIDIINNVLYEDIDIGKAHIQDVMEILLSIYGTWYSPNLENFKYYVDDTLEGELREDKSNISVASIPINNIKTIPINSDVSLPITFKRDDFSVQLILPRIENDIIAWKFAEKKHLEEENRISDSIKAVKKGIQTEEQMREYEKFTSERGKDFLRAMQSLIIYSLNGKVLETFSEKLDALSKIPLSVWTYYNKVVKENFSFGIQEDTQFICSIKHERITRRFRFRPIYFIPILDKADNSGFEISFG